MQIVTGRLTSSLITVGVHQGGRAANFTLMHCTPSGELHQRVHTETFLNKALKHIALACSGISIILQEAIASRLQAIIVSELFIVNGLVTFTKCGMAVTMEIVLFLYALYIYIRNTYLIILHNCRAFACSCLVHF